MNGREMFRQMTNDKQTSKHKLGNRTNRWSKVQADARCTSQRQFKQQQQQRRFKKEKKNDLIFNLRDSQFVYTARNIPNRI